MREWEKLSSRYVSEDGKDLILFRTRYDEMRNPRNGSVKPRLVLESVPWVNLVAIDTHGRSIMVRQHRFGVGHKTLATPGGMMDEGEDSLTSAQRELREEMGYTGSAWTYLGAVEPNPAIHNHLCHHWLATDVDFTDKMDLDEGEDIELVFMREEEIIDAVRRGEIRHALALSVLSRVFDLWPRPFAFKQSDFEAR